jgi:hypothetical protein
MRRPSKFTPTPTRPGDGHLHVPVRTVLVYDDEQFEMTAPASQAGDAEKVAALQAVIAEAKLGWRQSVAAARRFNKVIRSAQGVLDEINERARGEVARG